MNYSILQCSATDPNPGPFLYFVLFLNYLYVYCVALRTCECPHRTRAGDYVRVGVTGSYEPTLVLLRTQNQFSERAVHVLHCRAISSGSL